MPDYNDLASIYYNEDSDVLYTDVIHFIQINVREPHPIDSSSTNNYSTVYQPTTYEERVVIASDIRDLITGNQTLLVDDLMPGGDGLTNPVYCTYGPAPNSGYLIGQDGIIHHIENWENIVTMIQAIDDLLGG